MTGIRLRRWSTSDADLLREANTEAMTRFIAGPESADEVIRQHENYLRRWEEGSARMFVVLDGEDAVGGIGWWQTKWAGESAVETGWFVLPQAQGRGVAGEAVRLIIADAMRSGPPESRLYAFPSTGNRPSNALCARAGFELLGEDDFPFRGRDLRVNVWRHSLTPKSP
ncbi:GNAT family N-acetyltransferase [Arthrobacter agilis]|uniref:GNAT family N-acetyltransferase n=1 Tax=Arthrobacter agilis TaxID=37921 RepID=UPI0027D8371C|nr:GNAT family N-acetyltransferase [Arthrobacter agilis]